MTGIAPSPFVGRDEAYGVLRSRYALAESGAPQVVLVTGEAGIGKTRLVTEFAAGVDEASLVLATHCLELASAEMPLAPVQGLIHRSYRRLGDDALREAAGPYLPEIAALEPALGTADAAVDQLRVFAAVRHVLESLGTRLAGSRGGRRPAVGRSADAEPAALSGGDDGRVTRADPRHRARRRPTEP